MSDPFTRFTRVGISPAALAHGNVDAAGFYQGMATVVVHWDMSLLFIVAALWTAQHEQPWLPWVGTVLVFAVGTGFVLPVVTEAAAIPAGASASAFAATGLLVALQFPGRRT